MANTVIQLKKSTIPGSSPSSLALGELAINAADGKVFYKDSNNNIKSFSLVAVNSFSTVNANSTLLLATSPYGVLSIVGNNAINVLANSTSNYITVDVKNATTTISGVVQLSDSTGNSSTSLAATANSVNTIRNLAATKTFTFFQNTAPTSANSNDLWINTNTAIEYENFGNTTFPIWVELGPTGAALNVGPFMVTSLNASSNATIGASLYSNNGIYSSNNFTSTFTDGIVVDYVNGIGRISVGSADGLVFYNNGVGNNAIFNISSTGNAVVNGITSNTYLNSLQANISNILLVGNTAPLGGATNPIIGSLGNTNNYIQNYIWNNSNTANASADFVAYPNNGNDANGWIDVGITSNAYNQSTYSVTGRNEGYIFMSAPGNSGTSGNLVIATDSTGLYNCIEFITGGFGKGKGNNAVTIKNNDLMVSGNVTTNGNIISTKQAFINYNGANGGAALMTSGNNTAGGTNYFDFLKVTNSTAGATNPNKFFRITQTGALEIINSAYTANPLQLLDSGDLIISGNTTFNGIAPGYAPNRPAFRVYGANTTNALTTTQNGNGVLNQNNWAVDYSQGGYLNNTTGVFTAPVAGLYQVNVIARNSGYASGISQICAIKNSTIVIMVEWASSSSMNHTGGSTIVKLAVGDTLKLQVTGGQVTFDSNDSWAVAYIG